MLPPNDHAPSVEPAATAPPEGSTRRNDHLSEIVNMDHWLPLLVVTATMLLLALSMAVAVRLLSAIGHTLLLFSLGGLLAYALDPLVERVRNGRPERSARTRSVLLVFGCLALLGALGIWLLGAQLTKQVVTLAEDHKAFERGLRPDAPPALREYAMQTEEGRARIKLHETEMWLAARNIHVDVQRNIDHPSPKLKTWGQSIADRALKAAEGIGRAMVESLVVLLIALYFLIYAGEMRESLNRGLPPRLRAYIEQWQNDVNRILGGFVRGQLLLALVMGAMGAGLCLLLGIKFWLLIGLFVVVASLIPVIGPYIGAIPAVVSALIMPASGFLNPTARVTVLLVVFVIINEFGSKILYPRLVGSALGLHEVVVLFILFAGYEAGGLIGVLFAAPLTALAVVTLAQLYRLWQGAPPVSLASQAQSRTNRARNAP